jgi:hypothetical protein
VPIPVQFLFQIRRLCSSESPPAEFLGHHFPPATKLTQAGHNVFRLALQLVVASLDFLSLLVLEGVLLLSSRSLPAPLLVIRGLPLPSPV